MKVAILMAIVTAMNTFYVYLINKLNISYKKTYLFILNFFMVLIFVSGYFLLDNYVSSIIFKKESYFQKQNLKSFSMLIRKSLIINDVIDVRAIVSEKIQSGTFNKIIIKDEKNRIIVCKSNKYPCFSDVSEKYNVSVKLFYDSMEHEKLGSIEAYYSSSMLSDFSKKMFYVVLAVYILMVMIINFACYSIYYRYSSFFKVIIEFINSLLDGNEKKLEPSIFKEFALTNEKLYKISKSYHDVKNKIKEYIKADAYIKVSQQVAHDIRSPLTALNVVSKDLSGLHEGSRVLLRSSIQRIQDIANNLVSQSSEKLKNKENLEKNNLESSLLLSILEEIISEKRYQLRSRAGVSVVLDSEKAYGLFSEVHASSLKRIISNLINNSVEAFDGSGEIVVTVSENEKNNTEVLLSIKDNGKGISKDILPRLAQRGVSFGKNDEKESGSGLGLYHARVNIEQWGGRFLIESEEGKGTEIQLYLPKTKAPDWFVPAINLKDIKNIVILDDDESIHQVWDRRQRDYVEQHTINLQHARSPEDFKKLTDNKKNLLCLCDYELLGFEKTGLNLIEENGLENVSILVTSRYAEEAVQERCKKLGVKLIPKTSADLVPLNFEKRQSKILYDAILIDDDLLIHNVWNMRAKGTSKSILMFKDPQMFYEKVDEISRQTPIYIDQNLSEGQLGAEVAKTIASLGFKKLYLATGEEKSLIEAQLKNDSSIFIDIVGKDAPWD